MTVLRNPPWMAQSHQASLSVESSRGMDGWMDIHSRWCIYYCNVCIEAYLLRGGGFCHWHYKGGGMTSYLVIYSSHAEAKRLSTWWPSGRHMSSTPRTLQYRTHRVFPSFSDRISTSFSFQPFQLFQLSTFQPHSLLLFDKRFLCLRWSYTVTLHQTPDTHTPFTITHLPLRRIHRSPYPSDRSQTPLAPPTFLVIVVRGRKSLQWKHGSPVHIKGKSYCTILCRNGFGDLEKSGSAEATQ